MRGRRRNPFSCGGGGSLTATTGPSGGAATGTAATQPEERNGYSLDTYTAYYWEGSTVYNESVLPMREADGHVAPMALLYPIDSVESVYNAELTMAYTEGQDYTVEDGKLVIPGGSRIKVLAREALYLTEAIEGHCFEGTEGGYVYFSEGDYFHRQQIAVTYTHSGSWDGPVPEAQGARLPRTLSRLKNGETLNLVFFGDSICAGGNSTALIGAPPQAPIWADMVTESLRGKYPEAEIVMHNEAVGGTDSRWGSEQVKTLVCPYTPDLVVLAFGMNDATAQTSALVYQGYLQNMMNAVREVNPACEFVLVASMRSNPEAKIFQGEKFPSYLKVLNRMAGDGVVMADMTTLHEFLMTKKNFRDMTGNNINHCNDFLARAYAQLMIRTLSEEG